jgi:hypothetical protein
MYPDPQSNPLLPFKATTELLPSWQGYLIADSTYTFYYAPHCDILIQELYVGNCLLWYIILDITKDDQLIKFTLPPALILLLIYNIEHNGEIIFLHQNMGTGIAGDDYCYMGGGFSSRDLRVLISKGIYRTVIFPSFIQNPNIIKQGMRSTETFAFIEKQLLSAGIPFKSSHLRS